VDVNDGNFKGAAEGELAVENLSAILREREKTKRLLIGSVMTLFLVASLCLLFAPAGREKLGATLGATLLVLALGAIGASGFLLKLPGVMVDTKLSPPVIGGSSPRRQPARPQ
jgi:hypothetical protein